MTLSSKKRKSIFHKGFTIVELLIVIVVIAILAAITIVAYNGVQRQAGTAALKSDLNGLVKQIESANIAEGKYPVDQTSLKYSQLSNVTYVPTSGGYCVNVSNQWGSYFATNTAPGVQVGNCPPSISNLAAKGDAHSCIVKNNTIYCWGRNTSGQLGNGTTTDSATPVAVNASGALAGKTISKVVIGNLSTCALADGQVYCWGFNGAGRLGNGTTIDSPVPVIVSGLLSGKTVTDLAAHSHTCAVADNKAYCWGFNANRQIGDGTTSNSSVPVAVDTSGVLAGKSVTSVSAGQNNTCVIADNLPYCWGRNASGALGYGNITPPTDTNFPMAVKTSGALAGKTVLSISTGSEHSCVIASDHKAYCWGNNTGGRLGTADTNFRYEPAAVSTAGTLAEKDIESISAGTQHTCAVTTDKLGFCWGRNVQGQVGDNSTSDPQTSPVAVDTTGALSGKRITSIAAGTGEGLSGSGYTCAITTSEVFCWGRHSYQNGVGFVLSSTTPVLVAVP